MRISLSVLVIIDDQEMLNYFQTLLIPARGKEWKMWGQVLK